MKRPSKEVFEDAVLECQTATKLAEKFKVSLATVGRWRVLFRIPPIRSFFFKTAYEAGYVSRYNPQNHRKVAARALGRPLKKTECVHHIDGNILNNENTNLLICTRAYHSYLHHEMSRRYQQATWGKNA